MNRCWKNDKWHYEGEKAQRACKCEHCGNKILKGDGYKLIVTNNDYDMLHVECKPLYKKKASKQQKIYNHGFTWLYTITTFQSSDADALKNNDFISLSKKIVTCELTTRNHTNNYDFKVQKAVVTIKNHKKGLQETFIYSNIHMNDLTSQVNKESLRMGLYK